MLTIPKHPDPLDRSFFFLDKVDHTEICRIIRYPWGCRDRLLANKNPRQREWQRGA
jgi:hypothetical protein